MTGKDAGCHAWAALLLLLLPTGTSPAWAATETILYNITNLDVGNPVQQLAFYSTNCSSTCLIGVGDGDSNNIAGPFELGYSFLLHRWYDTQLLSLSGIDQGGPLTDAAGQIFGTSASGGLYDKGKAYELYYSGGNLVSTTIWSFGVGIDATGPSYPLVQGLNPDTLYGTTFFGGTYGEGTVYSLTWSGTSWQENVVYSFGAFGTDRGLDPVGKVYVDGSGNLYGATNYGGVYGGGGSGTIFELTRSAGVWVEKTLHSFGGGQDGAFPEDGVIAVQGALGPVFYGTTYMGGIYGNGTVYSMAASHGTWREGVIHSFSGGNDGSEPIVSLAWNPAKNTLYGTTVQGGAYNLGTVFALANSGGNWSETVLHSFGNDTDGEYPFAPVILDGAGNLYGSTYLGGSVGNGTIYEINF